MATGPTQILAVITPLSSSATFPKPTPPGKPTPPAAPDHTLPGDLPKPEHPIYYPLPPGAPVDPDYGVPDTHPDQGLPGDQPRPDHTLPGPQPHPEHPIVLPPDSGGWQPVYIWGPTDPRPTPPIVLPAPPTSPDVKWEVKTAWTATTGWIIVAVPTGAAPTPSKRR
jgi:hypothetical protein